MTICLSMIVRNEAATIRRCLESVRPWIDAWAIVDTGSTDGTQKAAMEALGDLPGGLLEQEWTDFATARNHALEVARMSGCEYAMILDADQTLVSGASPPLPKFYTDLAYVQCTSDGVNHWWREFLVRLGSKARWYRPIHESIVGHETHTRISEGLLVFARNDGSRRRDPEWQSKEVALLERCLEEQPADDMARFRLAGWYATLNQPEKAAPHIERLLTSDDVGLAMATRMWLESLEA